MSGKFSGTKVNWCKGLKSSVTSSKSFEIAIEISVRNVGRMNFDRATFGRPIYFFTYLFENSYQRYQRDFLLRSFFSTCPPVRLLTYHIVYTCFLPTRQFHKRIWKKKYTNFWLWLEFSFLNEFRSRRPNCSS